jgi:hypothetical protein
MKMNVVGEDKLKSPSANEEVPFDMKFSEVAGVGSSVQERSSFPADELKAGGIGSFNEVMEYMFGDASKKEGKVRRKLSYVGPFSLGLTRPLTSHAMICVETNSRKTRIKSRMHLPLDL